MTKEIINSLEKQELISDDDYIDYIRICLQDKKLEEEVDGVILTNDDSSGYITSHRILNFNPEDILDHNTDTTPSFNDLITNKERRRGIVKNPNTTNLYNLFVINHELRHIEQDKIMTSKEKSILRNLIIKDSISLLLNDNAFNNFYYEKFHDRFFLEYDANINSYISVLEVLNSLNLKSLKNLLIKSNEIISKHIIYCYTDINDHKKISTPIKNMYALHNHIINMSEKHNIKVENEIPVDKFSINEKPKEELEKLKYGLSIKKETYNYIKDVSKGKIKTLNLFEQIKN